MTDPGSLNRGPAEPQRATPHDPLSVRTAVRAFVVVLGVLPRSFTEEFLPETSGEFRSLARRAHARAGGIGVIMVLGHCAVDTLLRAPGEHWRERVERRRRAHDPYTGAAGSALGGWERMNNWTKELKLAVRRLARLPGFSAVVVFTLALGISANVAIFTVVNSVLIQPLPYPDSDGIVVVRHHAPGLDLPVIPNSSATIQFYQQRARSFSAVAAVDDQGRTLTGVDQPARVRVAQASPEIFDVIGVFPVRGRAFTDEDAKPGALPVAVISHHAWTSRFGSDPDILGQTVELDGAVTEIIGVMPEGIDFPERETFALLPMWLDPDEGFGAFGVAGMARLAPGVALEEANQEVAALQTQFPDAFPNITGDFLEQAGWSADAERLRDTIVGDVEEALWIVLGTVGFVLLIAGANVANIFLVRAESQQREVAIRSALGASRGDLIRHFLSESVVLGVVGGVVGLGLAYAGVQALVAFGPEELPRLDEIAIDGTVLAFAGFISLVAGLVFGGLPMLRHARGSTGALRDGSRGSTVGRARHRTRNLLVVGQLGLALVLLVGSGLMLRSFQALRSVDSGLRPEGVLTLGVSLGAEYSSAASSAAFFTELLDEIAALPGVISAGAVDNLPLLGSGINGGSFSMESRPRADDELPPVSMFKVVSPGYLETMGIPVLRGRTVTLADHQNAAAVAWVNETFANTFMDGEALGERVRRAEEGEWLAIEGVVGDVRHEGLNEDVRPTMYFAMVSPAIPEGADQAAGFLAVRAGVDPTSLVPAIRRIVQRINPNVPLTSIKLMDEVVAESMVETSFTMALLAVAATVALLLGGVGIYGVTSYVVSQRTREIGVRMALGARAVDVRAMVVRQGVGLTAGGVAVGVLGALGLSRVMGALLFGVTAKDPMTFSAVVILLVAVSLLASYLPAHRASAVSPTEALRQE